MNRSIALLLVCAFAAVGVALVRSGTASASPNPPQQARNRNESPGGQRVRGTKSIDHEDSVFVDISASLLPPAALPSGATVRSACFTAQYQHKMAFVGGARFHEYVDAASAAPIDLSAARLGITMDDPTIDPPIYRSYNTVIAPRAGLTWGQVADFANDLVIVSEAAH